MNLLFAGSYNKQIFIVEMICMKKSVSDITDFGKEPLVINIENATAKNNNFRTALWTGEPRQ